MDLLCVYFNPECDGDWLPGLGILILSAYVAAPAIGSIGLLEAERRWPLLHRSTIAAALVAMAVTFAAIIIWMGSVAGVAQDYAGNKALYRVLPYLALAVVAFGIWIQIRNRKTFSKTRAIGIACAIALPIVLFIVGQPA